MCFDVFSAMLTRISCSSPGLESILFPNLVYFFVILLKAANSMKLFLTCNVYSRHYWGLTLLSFVPCFLGYFRNLSSEG